jgi:hypothetical protein
MPLSKACLFNHIFSARSSCTSPHHSYLAPQHGMSIHSLYASHVPRLSILLIHLTIACLFIHISSARSSCTSSQYSSHTPLHSKQAYSFTFPQHVPHAPLVSILFMHLSIAYLCIPYYSSRSSCINTQHSFHAPLHSMPINSLFLTHLLSVFLSCTSL